LRYHEVTQCFDFVSLSTNYHKERGKKSRSDVMGSALSAEETTAGVAGIAVVLNDGCVMKRDAECQAN
jgi:hypothetical protein